MAKLSLPIVNAMARTDAQRLAARRAARFHLQARINAIAEPAVLPGPLNLRVTVVEVFRGAAHLPVGTVLSFTVPAADEHHRPPPGSRHADIGAARRARYIEAYLDGEPPALLLFGDEFEFIDVPSAQPVLPIPAPRGDGQKASLARLLRWLLRWRNGDTT